MLSVLKKVSKSEFNSNVLTLMSGTILAQAIPILLSPVLSRIYSVEEFGVYTTYFSILAALSIIVTARYELAILLPRENKDAEALALICFSVSCIVSIFLFIIFTFFNNGICFFLHNKVISVWLYLIPLSVLLNGFIQTFNYWANRRKDYKKLAISKALLAGVGNIVPLLIFFRPLNHGVLVIGLIIGQIVCVSYFLILYRKEMVVILKRYSYDYSKRLMAKYKEFPIYNTISSFVNQLGGTFPLLFITSFYGLNVAGLYGITLKVVAVPSALIAYSLTQVLFQKLSESYNMNIPLKPIIINSIKKLALLGFIPYLLLLVFGKQMFQVVFGASWGDSGIYAQIIAISCFFSFIASPLSITLAVNRKLKEAAIWQFLFFAISCLLIGIAFCFHLSIFSYLLLKAAGDLILYNYYLYIIIKSCDN